MPKFVLIGLCEPTGPDAQEAFDEWFVDQHIEDTAKCPNFIRGSVFKLSGPHGNGETVSGYLSLYEVGGGQLRRSRNHAERVAARPRRLGRAQAPPGDRREAWRDPDRGQRLRLVRAHQVLGRAQGERPVTAASTGARA